MPQEGYNVSRIGMSLIQRHSGVARHHIACGKERSMLTLAGMFPIAAESHDMIRMVLLERTVAATRKIWSA